MASVERLRRTIRPVVAVGVRQHRPRNIQSHRFQTNWAPLLEARLWIFRQAVSRLQSFYLVHFNRPRKTRSRFLVHVGPENPLVHESQQPSERNPLDHLLPDEFSILRKPLHHNNVSRALAQPQLAIALGPNPTQTWLIPRRRNTITISFAIEFRLHQFDRPLILPLFCECSIVAYDPTPINIRLHVYPTMRGSHSRVNLHVFFRQLCKGFGIDSPCSE